MKREIPVLYKRKEECCGCTACYAICPKEAIFMVEDEEGLPKGKRIDSYDEDAILGVELWANGLPRKILGYRTPDEAFEAEMDRIFAV